MKSMKEKCRWNRNENRLVKRDRSREEGTGVVAGSEDSEIPVIFGGAVLAALKEISMHFSCF